MYGCKTIRAMVAFASVSTLAGGAWGQNTWCDDFEDGVIDPTLWVIGGREIGVGGGGGVYSWSHEEVVAADGFLQIRIQGPATANTYGAEAWVRTLYDYNDGMDHLINFTWGAEVNASHIDGYAISINNGDPPPDGYFPIFGPDAPSNINLYCTVSHLGDRAPCSNDGQPNMSPVAWSILIAGDEHTAALYEGANGTGMLHNLKGLDPVQPWYIRLYHTDASSAGFPGSDNSLNVYNFCSQGTNEADTDGDGIPDAEDACPASDIGETIVIDGCDTGVENLLFEDGCTMTDLIMLCAEDANNHGQFVSCVAHLAKEWMHNGLITGAQNGAIQSCAAHAGIP